MHTTKDYSEFSGDAKVIEAMNDIEAYLSPKAFRAAIELILESIHDGAVLNKSKEIISMLTGISGYPIVALVRFCVEYSKWLIRLNAVDMHPYVVSVTMTDLDSYVWDSMNKGTVKERYVLKNSDEGHTLQYRSQLG